MSILPFVIGPAISAVGSIIGGNRAAGAARESANLQNEAAQRQLEYDTEAWEMKKQQLVSQRDYAVQEIEVKALNEGKQAAFQDASKARQYNYDLQIRNRQQASNEQQFQRSNEIYDNQLTLNEQAFVRGREKEIAKFDETVQEAAYDSNEAYIDSLMAEGKLRARGVTGRTADKLAATTTLQFGTKMAMLNASINNAALNSQLTLESIGRERSAADLRAYAARMLDPGELPMPIQPLPTPMSTYIYPRVFEDYDFGPEPVIGALASPGAAASQVWGTTISSIAGAIGGGFNSYAKYMNS